MSLLRYAFSNCTALTRVTLLEGVCRIEDEAFSGCTALTSIVIPASLTFVGDYALCGCELLASVYYGGTAEDWSAIDIRNHNTYLTGAVCYYYSESEPTAAGNHWCFDANGEATVRP